MRVILTPLTSERNAWHVPGVRPPHCVAAWTVSKQHVRRNGVEADGGGATENCGSEITCGCAYSAAEMNLGSETEASFGRHIALAFAGAWRGSGESGGGACGERVGVSPICFRRAIRPSSGTKRPLQAIADLHHCFENSYFTGPRLQPSQGGPWATLVCRQPETRNPSTFVENHRK